MTEKLCKFPRNEEIMTDSKGEKKMVVFAYDLDDYRLGWQNADMSKLVSIFLEEEFEKCPHAMPLEMMMEKFGDWFREKMRLNGT